MLFELPNEPKSRIHDQSRVRRNVVCGKAGIRAGLALVNLPSTSQKHDFRFLLRLCSAKEQFVALREPSFRQLIPTQRLPDHGRFGHPLLCAEFFQDLHICGCQFERELLFICHASPGNLSRRVETSSRGLSSQSPRPSAARVSVGQWPPSNRRNLSPKSTRKRRSLAGVHRPLIRIIGHPSQ
jgi:hypothetical protein